MFKHMLETLKIALSKPLVLHRKANGVGEGAGLARVQRGHGTCDPVHTVTGFLALLPEGQTGRVVSRAPGRWRSRWSRQTVRSRWDASPSWWLVLQGRDWRNETGAAPGCRRDGVKLGLCGGDSLAHLHLLRERGGRGGAAAPGSRVLATCHT